MAAANTNTGSTPPAANTYSPQPPLSFSFPYATPPPPPSASAILAQLALDLNSQEGAPSSLRRIAAGLTPGLGTNTGRRRATVRTPTARLSPAPLAANARSSRASRANAAASAIFAAAPYAQEGNAAVISSVPPTPPVSLSPQKTPRHDSAAIVTRLEEEHTNALAVAFAAAANERNARTLAESLARENEQRALAERHRVAALKAEHEKHERAAMFVRSQYVHELRQALHAASATPLPGVEKNTLGAELRAAATPMSGTRTTDVDSAMRMEELAAQLGSVREELEARNMEMDRLRALLVEKAEPNHPHSVVRNSSAQFPARAGSGAPRVTVAETEEALASPRREESRHRGMAAADPAATLSRSPARAKSSTPQPQSPQPQLPQPQPQPAAVFEAGSKAASIAQEALSRASAAEEAMAMAMAEANERRLTALATAAANRAKHAEMAVAQLREDLATNEPLLLADDAAALFLQGAGGSPAVPFQGGGSADGVAATASQKAAEAAERAAAAAAAAMGEAIASADEARRREAKARREAMALRRELAVAQHALSRGAASALRRTGARGDHDRAHKLPNYVFTPRVWTCEQTTQTRTTTTSATPASPADGEKIEQPPWRM